jgi:hypothetical protein
MILAVMSLPIPTFSPPQPPTTGRFRSRTGHNEWPVAPAWVESKGAVFFDYPFRDITQSLPLPWDETYLSEYSRFIADLGERYTDEERIRLKHLTQWL